MMEWLKMKLDKQKILDQFAKSLLGKQKDIDTDINDMVNENFNDLI